MRAARCSLPTSREPQRFGPYDVYEELSAGGLASTHRAVDRSGALPELALRRLRPRFASDPDLVAAFVYEASLTSRLAHPRIPKTFASGQVRGAHFAATELVLGPSLTQLITHARSAAGAIPVPIIVEILIQVCDTLDYLHRLSVVHRGVVPAAIVVTPAGTIKLVDFAIATAVPLPDPRIVLGPGHEAVRSDLDPRGDLRAVGAVAYELLTGREVARGGRPTRPSRWNAQVSADLDDIVLTALHPDRAQRWQNAAAMRFALQGVAASVGVADARRVRGWTEWALSREPRHDTLKITRLVESVERSLHAT